MSKKYFEASGFSKWKFCFQSLTWSIKPLLLIGYHPLNEERSKKNLAFACLK